MNNEVKRYRKKPVEVQAIQWDGTLAGVVPIMEWLGAQGSTAGTWQSDYVLTIKTLEGVMKVSPQDYVIQGVQGEFYPCKPDIFEATYDVIGESNE